MNFVRYIAAIAFTILLTSCVITDAFLPEVTTEVPTILLPIPTQSEVPTETLTPTSTPTKAPTPTATPNPPQRIQLGNEDLVNGDWDSAIRAFNKVLSESDDDILRSNALFGLGRVYTEMGLTSEALDTYRELISTYPEFDATALAHLSLGMIYEGLHRYQDSVEEYQNYIEAREGVLDSLIYQRIGALLNASGDYLGAIEAYQLAYESSEGNGQLTIKTEMGRTFAALGDLETAELLYKEVYNETSNDHIKAQMDHLLGYLHLAQGENNEAYDRFLDAVENYPVSYDTYLILVFLVESGYPVNEFDRGLIDYYAKQYTLSIAAFTRYLNNPDAERADAALYYKGLGYQKLGQYSEAIFTWQQLILWNRDSSLWADAHEQTAYLLWGYLEDYDGAIEFLLDFVSSNSWHPACPEFLFDAGRIAERAGDLTKASEIWGRIGTEYPGSEFAHKGSFQAGIAAYRRDNFVTAYIHFERSYNSALDPSEKAGAKLWMGKSLFAQEDKAGAFNEWQQAVVLDPTGYYSERSRDLLRYREPFSDLIFYDLAYDITSEQRAAEEWLLTSFPITQESLDDGMDNLLSDKRVLMGTELWQVGEYKFARDVFEDLRNELIDDPVKSYNLAVYTNELGIYRTAIFSSRQVLNNLEMEDSETLIAPLLFNHLRFGIYYRDLIIKAAEKYDIHPLLLLSVMRQESLYESFVGSSAGARGLMQIIPSTGEMIAIQKQVLNSYSSDDLYRPIISIDFGAHYLSSLIDQFDGNIYKALAGYNAGPGNSAKWAELSGDDPDLFLEIIRYSETYKYVKRIFENYSIYTQIYERSP